MTDEGMGPFEEPTPEPTTPAEQSSPMEGAKSALSDMADFSTGEGLVAFAGIIVLLDWVIFDVFTDDAGFGTLTLLLAALAVFVPRMNPETVAKAHPVSVIMKLAGYALALIGLIDVIVVVDGGFFDGYEGIEVVAVLVSWAAFAIAYFGARQIKI